MFTGIVDHCGVIEKIEGTRITVKSGFTDLALGESISVDGACLTALGIEENDGRFQAEISPETSRLTIAERYQAGTRVNLERSLRPADRMGGHWVTGHIDQKAMVAEIKPFDEFTQVSFHSVPESFMRYLVQKGSVAVNGVSLTINRLTQSGFEVMLIPHTWKQTNLSDLKVGLTVNLEFDWMVKVVLQEASRLALLPQAFSPRGKDDHSH